MTGNTTPFGRLLETEEAELGDQNCPDTLPPANGLASVANKRVMQLLNRERRWARAGHHRYDLNRHVALLKAVEANANMS